jgi:hypothetical protein
MEETESKNFSISDRTIPISMNVVLKIFQAMQKEEQGRNYDA